MKFRCEAAERLEMRRAGHGWTRAWAVGEGTWRRRERYPGRDREEERKGAKKA